MHELDILKIIKESLSDNSYIGDDCAYLKDLGLYITQDTLVEDIHFSLEFINAFQLAIKSVTVNISDLYAALAVPKYITISLSIPKHINITFIEDFYKGIEYACQKYKIKTVGGDITGSEKFMISVCAIGKKEHDTDLSRSNAKIGDIVFVSGVFGSSALGLEYLLENPKTVNIYTKTHLQPELSYDAVKLMLQASPERLVVMDSSDGLADALFKISKASKVSIKINVNKVPVMKNFYKESKSPISQILFGGEDYSLVFAADKNIFSKLDKNIFFQIGEVVKQDPKKLVEVENKGSKLIITEKVLKEKSYNHLTF